MVNFVSRLRYEAGRLMNAGRIAARVAYDVYRDEEQSVDSELFDTYQARISRYRLNTLYAEGKQYRPASLLRLGARFTGRYRHMRNIYNFVGRLIDLEVNKVYGGRIDWTNDLKSGAIPIVGANPTLLKNIMQILEWSNFGDAKETYVRNGARLGDSFLKSVSVFDGNTLTFDKVRIEVLDPYLVKDWEEDTVGNVIWICIEYEDIDDEGQAYTYREEIDKENVRLWHIYSNNPLTDFTNIQPTESYPNTYGFVPVTHVPHKNVGKKGGVTSFHGSLEKMDEINDIASVTNDGIRKAVNPMLIVKGGRLGAPNEELLKRDGILVFELPKADMDVQVVTPTVDVMASLASQDKMTSDALNDAPQTTLQRIREGNGDASGVAIENSYTDASDALEALQGNYDERLIRALQMALTMAGVLGLEGFPYDLNSYDDGELRFYIKERKVFSDNLSKEARARLILEAAQSPAWPIIARDLEVSDEDIALVQADAQERQAAQAAAAIRGLAQGFNMEDEEGDEDDAEPEGEAV
jgi:hypothetical protein